MLRTTLVFVFFLVAFLNLSVAAAVKCIEREREALLDFKRGLVDVYGILSSWQRTECCEWWGVKCDNITGHVTVLNLHARSSEQYLSGREVSPSLLELKHLQYLDLSFNDFRGSRIPSFIGSYQRLRVLSLKFANFSGYVPPHLGNLTNLRVLNITTTPNSLSLRARSLEWISGLSSLTCITLGGVQIESSGESITLPRSLEILQLNHSGLSGPLPFSLYSSSLSFIDLSKNHLSPSSVFSFLRNASKRLTTIDITTNHFGGPVPDMFQEMEFLENLFLGENSFTGGVPKSLGNLTRLVSLGLDWNGLNITLIELLKTLSESSGNSLQSLQLSQNKFVGVVPGNISTMFPNLIELDVSGNRLSGSFAPNLSLPSSLETLDFSDNQITGPLPDISHCSSLVEVYLSSNRLQGSIPEAIGKLSKLQGLDFSSNSLAGVVTEAHFSNLTDLQVLDLSDNMDLSFEPSIGWIPPFQLSVLYLAGCRLGPKFPRWIQSQSKIATLEINNCSISDTMPDWFWNRSTTFDYLDLSYNRISGTLPDLSKMFSSSSIVRLSYNNFRGPLPSLPRDFWLLDVSNNDLVGTLSFLCSIVSSFASLIDLSDNQFSGEIPDCWNNFPHLRILNLADNHLSGEVPSSLGSLPRLHSLHLRNNRLTGEFPLSMRNCSSLRVFDFGGNELTGKIPPWIGGGSLMELLIVSLRNNRFYGKIPSHFCHLNRIQILDLSGNRLSGEIPRCFDNFTYLMQNNRSVVHENYTYLMQHNITQDLDWESLSTFSTSDFFYTDNVLIQWKDKEWQFWKQMRFLKSIDLSRNELIGDIPEEISTLRGLISLNLSRNQLTGNIFEKIDRMENLESLDLSRNQLLGEIPTGLARLNYLAVLDLSDNSLSGKIPPSTQLQSFNVSSYVGNDNLCGFPLPKCPKNDPRRSNDNGDREDDDDGILCPGFYVSMAIGFSLFFWGIVGTLLIKQSWRYAYYQFLSDANDWVYVRVKICLVKMQQKLVRQ